MSVHRFLYRHLYRSAKLFDGHPVLKALITKSTTRATELDQVLDAFLAGQEHYLPAKLFPRLVTENVRQAFEFPPSVDISTDTAFTALRYLHGLLGLAQKHKLIDDTPDGETAVSKSRGSNKVIKMEVTPVPEPGALLLAHPLERSFFKHTVVLLVSSSASNGSSGFCLNKLVGKSVKEYVALRAVGIAPAGSTHPQQKRATDVRSTFLRSPEAQEHFGANQVLHGGPVPSPSLQVLHSHADLGGLQITADTPVANGLRCGLSPEKLQRKLAQGTIAPSDLTFLDGDCQWEPMQLEAELCTGRWVCLKALSQQPSVTELSTWSEWRGAQHSMWTAFMQWAGGEHAQLATITPALADDVAKLSLDDTSCIGVFETAHKS